LLPLGSEYIYTQASPLEVFEQVYSNAIILRDITINKKMRLIHYCSKDILN